MYSANYKYLKAYIYNYLKINHMKNLNAIGIDSSKAKHLAVKLNELLANYSIFYQNTRVNINTI
jgi:hypothetical protein